jgi:hypothetical protein
MVRNGCLECGNSVESRVRLWCSVRCYSIHVGWFNSLCGVSRVCQDVGCELPVHVKVSYLTGRVVAHKFCDDRGSGEVVHVIERRVIESLFARHSYLGFLDRCAFSGCNNFAYLDVLPPGNVTAHSCCTVFHHRLHITRSVITPTS